MSVIVQARLAEIAVLCRRYSVRRLALFGSATRPDFDPERSDHYGRPSVPISATPCHAETSSVARPALAPGDQPNARDRDHSH